MLVSFIVVVFNEAKVLPKTKGAIDRLIVPENVEIETIAIDGGSRDNSVAVARSCGFTQIIELPGANIPSCRNAGIKAAKGDWIAFVDGDCLLSPEWLQQAAALLEKMPSLILGWPASPPVPGTWVQRAWNAHWMNKNPAVVEEQGRQVVKKEGFRLITTRNMIFHRKIAGLVGGFDENLSTGEDTDFVFRATMAGIPAWGLPSLKSIHLGEPDTLRKFFKQQIWHANRKAYKAIMEKSGMKSGGNAPLFTMLFISGLLLTIVSVILGLFVCPFFFLGLLALPALLSIPAIRTGFRAGDSSVFLPLVILYGAYGLARSLDMLGLSPHKPSWKSTNQSAKSKP
jgi:glycosyltransferase involved in cell wall biosynthesis